MCEKFICGCEFMCVVKDNEVFGVIDIVMQGQEFYDYDVKYVEGGLKYIFFVKILLFVY